MKKYDVYVTELWTRRYSVEAETEEEAKSNVELWTHEGMGTPAQIERAQGDPEFEFTFRPDGSEVDDNALAWTVEAVDEAAA